MPEANQTTGSRSHRSLARLAPRWRPAETSTPPCDASQIMHAAGEDDYQTPLRQNQRKRHFLAALFLGCSGFKLDLWWSYCHGGLGWKLEPRLGKALRDAGGTGLRRRS